MLITKKNILKFGNRTHYLKPSTKIPKSKYEKQFVFRRRRPQELAEFLNSLMRTQNASGEKLPYHFSV